MSATPLTKPVEDSVPKVDKAIAVGENLEFQRKWWRFERVVWSFFLVVLICDVCGLFGRGWLAKASRVTKDRALALKYERIERASTPSIMTLEFANNAIENGQIRLFVSDSIVKPLGAQRISPQPEQSSIGENGITYTFPATKAPASVQIALEPSFPGLHSFKMQLPGRDAIEAEILVVP
jgi:hypothetical protein